MSQYTMTSENFKKRYALVNNPGKYKLAVRSVSNEMPNPNLPNGGLIRIVNFYAIGAHQITEDLKTQLAEGTVDVSQMKTLSINLPAGSQVPGKNETVDVTVAMVASKQAGKQVLGCTAMSIPPAVKIAEGSWDAIIAKEEPVLQDEGEKRTF